MADPSNWYIDRTLKNHARAVNALALLPDGRLASGSDDETIRLWDLETEEAVQILRGHEGSVAALAVTSEGDLASGSYDGTVRLWSLHSGFGYRIVREQPTMRVLAASAGGALACGSYSGVITVFNGGTGAGRFSPRGHKAWVTALAWLPDGRLASGSLDNSIMFWEADTCLPPSQSRPWDCVSALPFAGRKARQRIA